jgi:hypothetical protein
MPRIDWTRYNYCTKCNIKYSKKVLRCESCGYKVRTQPKNREPEQKLEYKRISMSTPPSKEGIKKANGYLTLEEIGELKERTCDAICPSPSCKKLNHNALQIPVMFQSKWTGPWRCMWHYQCTFCGMRWTDSCINLSAFFNGRGLFVPRTPFPTLSRPAAPVVTIPARRHCE